MPNLHIETQLSANGSGSLETHPSLNPDQWNVVHGLGIEGIDCISEVQSGEDTITALTFSHTTDEALKTKAQQLASGLGEAGITVSLGNRARVTAPTATPTQSLIRRMIKLRSV